MNFSSLRAEPKPPNRCKFYLNGECQLLSKKCTGTCYHWEKNDGRIK